MNITQHSIDDLIHLNKLLHNPSNPDLLKGGFKTIPAYNKIYNITKINTHSHTDNIKSILNKIHTSNFNKLYTKLLSIIDINNLGPSIITNIILEYLNKPSMLDDSLKCYSKIFAELYNNKYISIDFILKYISDIYYKKCYSKYYITNDISSIPQEYLPTILNKLNITPDKHNKINTDHIVDIMTYFNTITTINIKFIGNLQIDVFYNNTELADLIVSSFINNTKLNHYNLYSLNTILTDDFIINYIKKIYLKQLYNIYDNLNNFLDNNDYNSKMCEVEIEKIIYKIHKVNL
jgi:hypothetical protein